MAHAGLSAAPYGCAERRRLLLRWLGAATVWPLGACRSGGAGDAADAAAGQAPPGPPAAPPEAPAAEAERQGAWQGGPEPVSGKLRSGIVSWWRFAPESPRAGEPFELILRLESIRGRDAQLSLMASDGARIVNPSMPPLWALRPGRDAQVHLRLIAPAGDSYLHVQTRQDGRSSVRSIRLALPAAGAASVPPRRGHELDANGQPVVRMPARAASS